jgi:tetratricopeptide (TPR) repeat protein
LPNDQPSAVDVRTALEAVCASEVFRGSGQLVSFLRFSVEATLNGEKDRLKGYTIATQALGRDEDFDPQTDPIVRVEAIRLRKLLDVYYEGQGALDPVRITMPRGGYAVAFQVIERPAPDQPAQDQQVAGPDTVITRTSTEPRSRGSSSAGIALSIIAAIVVIGIAAALWLRQPLTPTPTAGFDVDSVRYVDVIVTPFEHDGPIVEASGSARRLGLRILEAMSRFEDVRVRRGQSNQSVEARDAPSFLLTGSYDLRFGEALVSARLEHSASGEVVWSRRLAIPLVGPDAGAAEDALVRTWVTELSQTWGVIHASALQQISGTAVGNSPYGCVTRVQIYWRTFDEADHGIALNCLQETLRRHPEYSPSYALMAYLRLDEYRFGYNRRPQSAPLDEALELARTAVRLAPGRARAVQALCSVYFVRQDRRATDLACETVIDMNPYDNDLRADVGVKNLMEGRFRIGVDLLDEAIRFSPLAPNWYVTFSALGALMLESQTEVIVRMRRAQDSRYPPGRLLKAIALDLDGQKERARAAFAQALVLAPGLSTDPRATLERMFPNAAILDRLTPMISRLAEK